jgi:hypothetical protein
MRNLLIKCLVLALIVSCILFFLNAIYIKTDAWKYQNHLEQFAHIPQHIRIANFGSSHGLYSFEWSSSPYQAFNFGLSGQSHLYDYALLQQYSNHFDKNAVVIFLIEYIEQIKIDYSDQISRYYRILDKAYMPEYSLQDHIRYSAFPVLGAGDTIRSIVSDYNPEVKFQKIWHSTMSEEELVEYSSKYYIGWTTDSPDGTLQKRAEGFIYNQKILSDIIDYCLARELQPVLISTPITGILNAIFEEKTPDFFETFYRFSRELSEKYPNVPYLDYSHDKRFENDSSLFRDGDHLNIYGAKKFTLIVIEDIQSLGLLPMR